MRIIPNQDEINHRLDMWQVIRWRMNTHKVDPKELASQTPYSQDHIERGINGEPIPLTFPFLCACVDAFGLSGRGKYYEDTIETRSTSEVETLLKPPPAMPPPQGDFWEREE